MPLEQRDLAGTNLLIKSTTAVDGRRFISAQRSADDRYDMPEWRFRAAARRLCGGGEKWHQSEQAAAALIIWRTPENHPGNASF